MGEPHIIAEYVESLAARLSFDPSLSQRVRREVEDHLYEAVARGAAGKERVAAEKAIAQFGNPQVLAAEFAIARLVERTQKASAGAILLVGVTLLAMKARLAWYGITQWQLGDDLRALATTIGVVDAYAFWLAGALTVSGWVYLIGKPIPASNGALCRQLRHVVCLNSVSATALSISVTCDAILTVLRLLGRDLTVQSLIPLFSMMAEFALTSMLILSIYALIVRMTHTSRVVDA